MRGMPVVATIRTAEKSKGFFEVSVVEPDGSEQIITVHEDVLVQEALHRGKDLSAQQFVRLKKEAEGIKAYHASIRFLSFRMRSVSEMRTYLAKKEFLPVQIDFAIKRLIQEKLLDDRAFAASFVRTRMELSTKGPQLIYRELLQAGIDQATAQEAVELYPDDLQIEHARKYLAKQTASVKNRKSRVESRQVLSRQLMQRGYSQAISKEVLDEISDFLKENEKSALAYQAEKAVQKYKKLTGDAFSQKVKEYLFRKGFPIDEISVFLDDRINTEQKDWG